MIAAWAINEGVVGQRRHSQRIKAEEPLFYGQRLFLSHQGLWSLSQGYGYPTAKRGAGQQRHLSGSTRRKNSRANGSSFSGDTRFAYIRGNRLPYCAPRFPRPKETEYPGSPPSIQPMMLSTTSTRVQAPATSPTTTRTMHCHHC